MTRRRAALCLLLLGALAAGRPTMAQPDRGACAVPDQLLSLDAGLEHTRRLARDLKPIRLAVVGPPLTATDIITGRVQNLAEALRRRLPRLRFEVEDLGVTPGLAVDDWEKIRDAADQGDIDLVVWQVGVADAVAGSEPVEVSAVVAEASHWLGERGIDLIVLDPPFSPYVEQEARYERITASLRALAQRQDVGLLQQYKVTRYLQQVAKEHNFRRARGCVTRALAEAVGRAVTPR